MARTFNAAWLAEIEEALALGVVGHAVIVSHHAEAWGVPSRVVRRYLAEVLRQWGSRVTDATPEEQRADLAARMLSCYADARRRGHLKVALSALDSLAKLLGLVGLNPSVQVMNVLDASGALTSPEAVRARLAELKAKQLTGGDDGGA